MKGIIRGRKKRKFNGHTFWYYSIVGHKERTIEKDELYRLGSELPPRCKQIVRKVDLFHVSMTKEEQDDMSLLCSLSIYCWNGGPRMNIPGISMEDYTNDFYIHMTGYLRSWNPEKGPWPSYVKFVRLKTLRYLFNRWETVKREMEVKNFHSIDRENVAYDPWDRDSIELGTSVSEGRAVRNLNPR